MSFKEVILSSYLRSSHPGKCLWVLNLVWRTLSKIEMPFFFKGEKQSAGRGTDNCRAALKRGQGKRARAPPTSASAEDHRWRRAKWLQTAEEEGESVGSALCAAGCPCLHPQWEPGPGNSETACVIWPQANIWDCLIHSYCGSYMSDSPNYWGYLKVMLKVVFLLGMRVEYIKVLVIVMGNRRTPSHSSSGSVHLQVLCCLHKL